MSHFVFHRRSRLAVLWALLDLSTFGRLSDNRNPSLPTTPQLRRDIGLSEMDPEPPIYTLCGRRF